MEYHLKCSNCGNIYDDSYNAQVCEKCGGILEVVYEGRIQKIENLRSFWDLEPVLPGGRYKHLEVGFTKLIPAREKGLHLKLEVENPTHSFKDRGSVIEVAKAKEYGYDELVCASTGNMAYSLAYYAKVYGIKAKIFVSKNVTKDKMEYIRKTHDAEVVKINGDFNEAQRHAEKYAKRRNVFLAGDYCYRKEGQKTIAYELAQFKPDCIIVPVGNATLLSGTIKAVKEMRECRMIDKDPTIIGVEAEKCKPLYDAFAIGKLSYTVPKTAADAIAVGYPTFGPQVLAMAKKSKINMMVVSDKEMAVEQRRLYEDYGLVAELAGVSGIAAYRKLKLKYKNIIAIISGGNI